MKVLLPLLLLPALVAAQWTAQKSNTTASFRGISAVNPQVAWASGTGGTFVRTTDGGQTWSPGQVPGAEKLDFRDVESFDAENALLLSIGPGEQSRIYQTSNGGITWKLAFQNPEPKGFFDAISFWNRRRGLLLGDAVDGQMYVAVTSDGGSNWKRVPVPLARDGEGAFAASGTCIATGPGGRAWFVTGGIGGSRVYHSSDWGQTWEVSDAPVRHEKASAGIFGVAFRDAVSGVLAGGDYAAPTEDRDNFALTADGGKTWVAEKNRPLGFRSAISYLPGTRELIAAGTSGIDHSADEGKSWESMSKENVNAISFATRNAGWAVGPKGVILRYYREPK